MSLQLITPPSWEPVSLALAKNHLRVDIDEDDNLIAGLIAAARVYCEKFQNRAYLEQTWDLWLDSFPLEDSITIPLPPLQSVVSIKYYDADDTEYTLSADDYIVDGVSQPGRIILGNDKSWPGTALKAAQAVVIRFTAGYATYTSLVNTNAAGVTKVSGDDFNTGWSEGKLLNIAGATYRLASTASAGELTLAAEAGEQNNVLCRVHDIPEVIQQAMLLLIGHWYENREAVLMGMVSKEVEYSVKSLLSLDKVVIA